jgi:hypothetical protein
MEIQAIEWVFIIGIALVVGVPVALGVDKKVNGGEVWTVNDLMELDKERD